MERIIYKTDNFSVKVPNIPHITREEGGHIFIEANNHSISERSQLSPSQIVEMSWLLAITSQAYWNVMKNIGIMLYRLNYQDNGQWAFIRNETPVLHIHIYGRAIGETNQEYGQALYLPYPDTKFYDNFIPLNEEDISLLREEIQSLSKTEKFNKDKWCFNEH